jgi:UDP-glucuronate 4-epimerase
MARAYHHLHGLSSSGLRFFTVYGPWGRPDMAFFKFTKAILAGEPIEVFNNGEHRRAFTYIDDVVDGIVKVLPLKGCEVYNIGGDESVPLMQAVGMLEAEIGREAALKMLPMQKGDVLETTAEMSRIPGWSPKTPLALGILKFVDWYKAHYA